MDRHQNREPRLTPPNRGLRERVPASRCWEAGTPAPRRDLGTAPAPVRGPPRIAHRLCNARTSAWRKGTPDGGYARVPQIARRCAPTRSPPVPPRRLHRPAAWGRTGRGAPHANAAHRSLAGTHKRMNQRQVTSPGRNASGWFCRLGPAAVPLSRGRDPLAGAHRIEGKADGPPPPHGGNGARCPGAPVADPMRMPGLRTGRHDEPPTSADVGGSPSNVRSYESPVRDMHAS